MSRRRSILQKLCIFWLPEVLQIGQVGYEVRFVKHFVLSQVVEINRVGKTLHKLQACLA